MPTTNRRAPPENGDTNEGRSAPSPNRYWRSQPDDSRETWAIVSLGVDEEQGRPTISGWQLATANATGIVRTHRSTSKDSSTLNDLYEILDEIRQDGGTLLTPTRDTLRHLRTGLLRDTDLETPTLRGLSYVPLVEVVTRHFAAPDSLAASIDVLQGRPVTTVPDEEVVRICWQVRKSVGHLVPQRRIQGEPL
jgi:hypothetical protein